MLLICFGTRPEYIKILSLINNFPRNLFKLCFTGQHIDLLNNIKVDYNLNINYEHSTNRLNNIVSNILKYSNIFENINYVLIQGDTTTAFSIALSAFHHNIKIIHLEGGLRTFDINDPFPEEFNRQCISKIASIHLCPTVNNKQNLLNEGINEKNIYVVGNTVLDNINRENIEYNDIILITLHRRNNFETIDKWFIELEKIAIKNPTIKFIFPMHPNPNIQKYKYLLKYIKVIEPVCHDVLIDYIKKCKFIITDSGGIQEESSFLNKKCIICRNSTERQEILESGHGLLCKSPDFLEECFQKFLNNYKIDVKCPFGDGNSYKKIINILNSCN